MKKLIPVLLVLPFFAFMAADWISVALDERVAVDFPAQPELKDMSGNKVWVQDVDKDSRCMAMIVDFKSYGMDSAKLAEEMSKEQSFADFRQGVLGQIAGATLISEKKSTINGKIYFEYVINMNKEGDAFNIMYSRNIFAGTKMYTLSFYEKNNLPREQERNKFFTSFKMRY
jgi:hypothetical protein